MMGDNTRQYQVNYAITISDQASSALTSLGEAAKGLAVPMGEAVKAIESVQSTLIKVKEQVGTSLTITPSLATGTLQASLTELETMCSASAKKIATMMGNAMVGVGSQSAITVPTTKKEIENQIKENEKQIKVVGKREQKALERRNKELEEMKKAGNKKGVVSPVEALRSYSAIASKAENLGKVGDAIKKINENINLCGTKAQKTITVDADISPAISKINSLLETIRKSTAALPITVAKSGKAAVEGTKGGKYIDKNGNLTKTGKGNIEAIGKAKVTPVKNTITDALAQANQAVTDWQKTADRRTIKITSFFNGYDATLGLEIALKHMQELASKRPVSIRSTFNGGDAGFQLNMSIKNLQELASKRPVSIRSTFNGGDAGFQLNMSLKHLQELAAKNPIVIRAVLSQDGLIANKGTASSNIIKANNNAAASEKTVTNVVDKANKKAATSERSATAVTPFSSSSQSYRPSYSSAAISEKVAASVAPFAPPSQSYQPSYGNTATSRGATTNAAINAIASTNNSSAKIAGETEKAVTPFHYPSQSQTNAAERHLESMSKMRIERMASEAKFERNMAIKLHIERQRMYDELFGRDALHREWVARDKAGKSTRAKNIEARAKRLAAIEAEIAKKEALDRQRIKNAQIRNAYRGWEEPMMPANQAAANRRLYSNSQMWGGNRAPRPTEGLYQRARAFWYPFTGNTSFGARSSMAVDMAKGMGTMFAIGGAMSAIGSSLHQSVAYQNTMKTTQAILQNGTKDYSDKSFKAMENTVRQVGKETKFTAPQVASAAKFLAMAGYNTSDIKSAINPVANIALIGDTNLGETADKLTNVMTTFGIQPGKMNDIADIMTSTFTRSNTDMMMLAESAKYAGGIANLYGGRFKNNFSDVMAMFGILGNAGIQASSAGTTLRMMYQNLMQPNKNQLATLQQYGIFTRDASGAPLEMVNILKQIYEKVPKGELADAVGNMFRITAQPGASTLAQAIGSGKLVELMEANRNAAGSGIAQTIADEKKNTVAGLWAQVQSTFTEGILQAFENREGGWASMLIELRDYLAKPETVQMLSSLVDLVENLVIVVGQFAKVYAKVYSMFPNLINNWMFVQLLFTQLGYLATPIIQLLGVLDRFTTGILGVTAVTTAATVAENGRKAAIMGSAATGVLGGSRYVRNTRTAAEFAAYNASMAQWNNMKVQYERKANILRNSMQRESGMRTTDASPLNLMYSAPMTNSNFRGMRQYSAAERAAADAQRIQSKMDGLKAQRFNAMRNVRRPEQLINEALLTRYMAMDAYRAAHNPKYTASSVRGQVAGRLESLRQMREKNKALGIARAANRTISPEVAARYNSMFAGKMSMGNAWKTNLIAGRAIGTFNLAVMGKSLMGMATKFVGVFAKFIGMLTSPIGLIITAIVGIATAIYLIWNKFKTKAENLKLADENSKWKEAANINIKKAHIQASIDVGGGFKPVEIGYSKSKEGDENKTYKISNPVADILADADKVKGLTGRQIVDKYVSGFDALPQSYVNGFKANEKTKFLDFINMEAPVGIRLMKKLGISTTDSELENMERKKRGVSKRVEKSLVEDARKLGMVALWAEEASKQTDLIQAMKDIQEAVKNKDMAKAQDILEAYRPTSNVNMLNMANAEDIRNIEDPTKFREWQETQFKILNDLVQKYQSPLLQYEKAMGMIEQYQKLDKKEKKGYDATALAQTLIQSIPIIFNGSLTAIGLDKMGRINWSELAKSVNDNIPLSVAQQQSILQSMYTAIYNDPNIKNCTFIIDLLKKYLPAIANESNPYEEGGGLGSMWDTPKEDKEKKGPMKPKTFGTPGYLVSQLSNINIPKWQTDFDRAYDRNKTLVENTIAFNEKHTGQSTTTNKKKDIKNVSNNTNSTNNAGKNQKDYANKYGRDASRPTQVIINIGNLANFDKTTIAKNADDRAITNAIETKIAEAVSMLSAQILTTASSTVSQGLS